MRLSAHFDSAEFASHDGARTPARQLLWLTELCRDYLEPLRREFGPVTITSGFRSASHNRAVGGAPLSYHTRRPGRPGAAADVQCKRGTPREWFDFLDRCHAPGLGLYPTWVHVDNREGRARW